jgi:hypothetical protein
MNLKDLGYWCIGFICGCIEVLIVANIKVHYRAHNNIPGSNRIRDSKYRNGFIQSLEANNRLVPPISS